MNLPEMPDWTSAQNGAVAQFAAALIAAHAAGLRGAEFIAVVAASTLLAVALCAADAVIRRGRAGMISGALEAVPATTADVDGEAEDAAP